MATRAAPDTQTAALPGGTRFLLTAACLVIVVAGLKAASSLILPFLLAAMLSIVFIPPMRKLQQWGIPSWLAIVLIILVAALAVFLVSGVIGDSVSRFQASYETDYAPKLEGIVADGLDVLRGLGVKVPEKDRFTELMDPGAIFGFVADTTSGILGAVSNLFLVLLTMLFMLGEASGFPAKLQRALGSADADLSRYAQITRQVYEYLSIKALMSLVTGVLVAVLTAAVGVDFPVLWGLVTFLFNFIPNIGSIIAAGPVVLMALIQFNLGTAALVAAGIVLINQLLGNVIEPRIMGQRLGLSTLVVFLSLLFWGWVWGPVGMLLSVPLTVMVKIVMENTEQFRTAAVLLGPGRGNESSPPAASGA